MQGKTPDECLDTFKQAYKQYADTYVPDRGSGSQLRYENLNKILSTYLALNSLNSVDFEVVETERQVTVELYHDADVSIHFSDKMDGKVRMHDSGSLASVEHKTGEYIDDSWFSSYDMDGQVTGHVVAGSAVGDPVIGVVINAIQFNKLPEIELKKNGQPKTCRQHHIPVDQCQFDHVKFVRRLFARSPEDIADWKTEVIRSALEYYRLLRDTKSMDQIANVPMNGLLKRSCRYCEFKDFCRSHRMNQGYIMQRPVRGEVILRSGLSMES